MSPRDSRNQLLRATPERPSPRDFIAVEAVLELMPNSCIHTVNSFCIVANSPDGLSLLPLR